MQEKIRTFDLSMHITEERIQAASDPSDLLISLTKRDNAPIIIPAEWYNI